MSFINAAGDSTATWIQNNLTTPAIAIGGGVAILAIVVLGIRALFMNSVRDALQGIGKVGVGIALISGGTAIVAMITALALSFS